MHDPSTVAFDLPFITIWHRDPESDGSDDSCDWANSRNRRLRIHPRLHIWHWRIQIHAIGNLKRWLFSRCAACGKRFSWGYAPISNSWNGGGARWFRGEPGVYHHDCIGGGP